jgi:predicted outer membrane repeat protein
MSKVAVATASNSTCTGNKADRFAGAVFLSGGGTVSNVQFNNNSATSGGAIYTQVTVKLTTTMLTLLMLLNCSGCPSLLLVAQ